MTIEEKANIIKEAQEKNNLIVSPRRIEGGAKLIYDSESLRTYEAMEDNTNMYAESEIVNIIAEAKKDNQTITKALKFTIVFEGGFEDLPKDNLRFIDFVKNYSDRMVAVKTYVKSERTNHFFVGYDQTETIYDFGHIYLRLSRLFELFKENNISFNIDLDGDNNYPTFNRDDSVTTIAISYSPKKEMTDGISRTLNRKPTNN